MCCVGICISLPAAAQNPEFDSLKLLLKTASADTNKVCTLNYLASKLKSIGELDLASQYAVMSESLCEKLLYDRGLVGVYLNQGLIYQSKGIYPKALECMVKSLKISEKLKYKLGIGNAYCNIGNIYWEQQNLNKALEYQTKCLKLREEYLPNGKQVGDKNAIATSLSNIGIIYHDMKNYSMAFDYHLKALALMQGIENREGEANSLNNIGSSYGAQKNFEQSLHYYTSALEVYAELGNKSGMALSYYNLGNSFFQRGAYKKAEANYLKGLKIVTEIVDLHREKDFHLGLSIVYQQTGKPKKALEYYKSYILTRNNIFNEENTKKTVQSEMIYEFEKKEATARLEQEKRESIAHAESKKQKAMIWSIFGILILVFIFSLFVYRSFLQKKKINIEITNQKHLIEEKQKEILDSIHYAKRIQTALLTSERYIDKSLNNLQKKIER